MSALMCGRCPATGTPTRVNGLWTDPPGWSVVTLTGLPMLNRTVCPSCTTEIRALLATPPDVAQAHHDTELEAAYIRGYANGQADTHADAAGSAEETPR